MNDIDIKNIKKELAKRKATNYAWEDGGDMCKDDVMLRTTMDLNDLVKSYEGNQHNLYISQIKEKVDYIFKTYGKEDENIILLERANRCDYDIYSETDYWENVYSIEWEGSSKYNSLCFPIFKDVNKLEDISDDFYKDLDKLYDLLNSAKINWDVIDLIDNNLVNESWYGFTAITRDYRIIVFSMRYDGILSNDKLESEKFIY